MKIIRTAKYKKAFQMDRYESGGMLGEDMGMSETEGMISDVYDFEEIKNMIYLQDRYIETQGTSVDPLGDYNQDDVNKEMYLETMAEVEREDPHLRQQFEERENQKAGYGDDSSSFIDDHGNSPDTSSWQDVEGEW